MRALITGGTEFISLHLAHSLLARGHEVVVFNRGRRPERLPASVRVITGDRKDHSALRELGLRPRYTLGAGLAHTWKWYQGSGLLERPIDFTFEDELLAKLGA